MAKANCMLKVTIDFDAQVVVNCLKSKSFVASFVIVTQDRKRLMRELEVVNVIFTA